MERYRIFGVPVDNVTYPILRDKVEEVLSKSIARQRTIIAINPLKILSTRNDKTFLKFFEDAFLLIPDGIGVVLALRFLFKKRITRVTGADSMPIICGIAQRMGCGIFVLGAEKNVNEIAVQELKKQFPQLVISGNSHGFTGEKEMDSLINSINNSGAEILFLALGSPKQEQWMMQHLDKLSSIKLCQGIGGTLDVLAGRRKRPSKIVQKLGLEWLFRVLQKPNKCRFFKDLVYFSFLVLKARIFRNNQQLETTPWGER